ncbi:hypothetical protein ACTXT7_011780 [Hymenolepis weldensis]
MVDCNLTSRVKALLLFNGLPGSGKSYTANELVKNARNYKFISIHFDKNIAFGDNDDYASFINHYNQGDYSCGLNNLHVNLCEYSNDENTPAIVILDDNFYYRSMRKQYYQLSKILRIAYMSVSFRTSLEICIKRNAERVTSVPESIIHRMNFRFEWPDAAISPWERYNLELGGSISDVIVEEIEKFVEFVLKQPLVFIDWEKLEAERNKSREINRMNPIHVIDDVLRSLVNACVISLSPELRQKYGKEFGKVKAMTLNQLRPSACDKFASLSCEDFDTWIQSAFGENLRQLIPIHESFGNRDSSLDLSSSAKIRSKSTFGALRLKLLADRIVQ